MSVRGAAVSSLGFALLAVACGGSDDGGRGPRDASMDAGRADANGLDGTAAPPDTSWDGAPPVLDGGLDDGRVVDPTAPTECVRQTVVIGRNPTSSCGFDLPVSIATSLINIRIARSVGANGTVVCRVGGSGSCWPAGGWFMVGRDSVALCDESCLAFERAGPTGVVVAELGCDSAYCRDSCHGYGEACGPADDCCPGYACDPGTRTCVPCRGVGASCSTDDDRRLCCSASCGEGACCYDFDDPCRTDADCCAGTCEGGFCGCPAPQALCDGACVDVSGDRANCGTCGNACGAGATCVSGTCTCAGSDLYCGGTCVDPTTDASHCGGCSARCRADQVCRRGSCTCPAGQTECSGVCADLSTDRLHCGACGTRCGSLYMCAGGTCVCRSDLTLCGGSCVDTDTSNSHCGSCGRSCMGMRRCMGGVCS